MAAAEFTAGRKALNESIFTSLTTSVVEWSTFASSVTADVRSTDECHGMATEVVLHGRLQDLPVRSTEALNSLK